MAMFVFEVIGTKLRAKFFSIGFFEALSLKMQCISSFSTIFFE